LRGSGATGERAAAADRVISRTRVDVFVVDSDYRGGGR
jgi:hypothetical protein